MSCVTPHLDALHLAQLDGDVIQLVFLRRGEQKSVNQNLKIPEFLFEGENWGPTFF